MAIINVEGVDFQLTIKRMEKIQTITAAMIGWIVVLAIPALIAQIHPILGIIAFIFAFIGACLTVWQLSENKQYTGKWMGY